MGILISNSFKRLKREGIKTLVVPLIAFTLVGLLNSLGGIADFLNTQYYKIMNNYEIKVELSDLSGTITEGLSISADTIEFFTNSEKVFSLQPFTSNLVFSRNLGAELILEPENFKWGDEDSSENVIDEFLDYELEESAYPPAQDNFLDDIETLSVNILGVNNILIDEKMSPDYGVSLNFFDGYNESDFDGDELIGLVSEDLLDYVVDGKLVLLAYHQYAGWWDFDDTEFYERFGARAFTWGGRFLVSFEDDAGEWWVRDFDPSGFLDPSELELSYIEGFKVHFLIEISVIGYTTGTDEKLIVTPFSPLMEHLYQSTGIEPQADRLHMTLRNNRHLSALKGTATFNFSRVMPIGTTHPNAMTIFDSEFFELLEPIVQNRVLIDVAIPIIYVISVFVGFLTSMILTRQRKSEFATLRSIGVKGKDIFVVAISEQLMLCLVGALLGSGVIALSLSYFSYINPLIFIGCYMLGAIFAASNAARTNVLSLLKDKE